MLTPEKKELARNEEDVLFVRVSVTDAKGVECPLANNEIKFAAEGAEIVGTDNGDQRDTRGLTQPIRNLYNGLCVVAIRWDGKSDVVCLTATSEGMEKATVTIPVAKNK